MSRGIVGALAAWRRHGWARLAGVVGVVVYAAMGVACSDEGVDTPPPLPPFLPLNAVDEADPRHPGQEAFLRWTWGVEVLGGWPPADFMLGLMQDEPEVFGRQYERFGFLPDPSDDFPVGFKRGQDDPNRVHETCALCHVAALPTGGHWLGAPNNALDIGRFQVEVNRRWVAAGNSPLFDALMEDKLLALGPGRTRAETASYPVAVPAAFPVYYNLGDRQHLNYMGTGRDLRTEVSFSLFTFGAGNPNPRDARVPFPSREHVDALVAFMGALDPPPAPPQDPTLAARGRQVFEAARCVSCHVVDDVSQDFVVTLDRDPLGRERHPGEDPAFPRGTIRTSALHRVLQDGDEGGGPGVDEGFRDLIRFMASQRLAVRQTDGYRVNDLRGLWQSAPYLHNGSVPTLEALLSPAASRPETFAVAGGWVVDTRVLGNGAEGHEFGTDLSDEDKRALIAYLLSL